VKTQHNLLIRPRVTHNNKRWKMIILIGDGDKQTTMRSQRKRLFKKRFNGLHLMVSLRIKSNMKKKMVSEVSITNLNKTKKRKNRNTIKLIWGSLERTRKRTLKIISKNHLNRKVSLKKTCSRITPLNRMMSRLVLK
jgi:hypothetical protein